MDGLEGSHVRLERPEASYRAVEGCQSGCWPAAASAEEGLGTAGSRAPAAPFFCCSGSLHGPRAAVLSASAGSRDLAQEREQHLETAKLPASAAGVGHMLPQVQTETLGVMRWQPPAEVKVARGMTSTAWPRTKGTSDLAVLSEEA